MSKKKMGRPAVDNPKNIRVVTRLDEDMYKKLEKYSNEKGLPKTEIIRQALEKFIK